MEEIITSFQTKKQQQQEQISTMIQLHTKEVDKSMAEVRQCQTTILESRNKIKEMKAEVHDMLEEMREGE